MKANRDEFFDTHDGRIVIASNRHRGIWTNIIALWNTRTTRNAGCIPFATATHDTLLAIGLTSALSSITQGRAKKLAKESGRANLKIQVRTASPTFADLLTKGLTAKQDPRKNGFRAAHQMVLPLFRQLVRFDVEFVVESADEHVAMRQWASNVLYSETPVFSPQVVQQFF